MVNFVNVILLAAAAVTVSAEEAPAAPAAANTEFRKSFPKPSGIATPLRSPMKIAAGQSFDGKMQLYDRSSDTCKGQSEGGDDDAVFILAEGATLSNVVIGPKNGEGVHCMGTCTINNVWWTKVCEDALTLKQKSGISYVNGGGAKGAKDKVIQHNGGGTIKVKNFYAEDIGKLYRSCGNCAPTVKNRHSEFTNVYVNGGKIIAGVNGNFGDTTKITGSCIKGGAVCNLFKGVSKGKEPSKTASVPDGKTCSTAGPSTC
ncbi:polysaccharide lyase family 3 protein [Aulographum hederae CBS 113979]|uniref:Pectate lyase n=1 Tax=Aulographum hederae CBS 113979 TaxID=1176131 RepID=A0A6G1GU88_9PEZI|nr:polysaccharide lyase family 3 protein [Aulographum hederae CBS 113979]